MRLCNPFGFAVALPTLGLTVPVGEVIDVEDPQAIESLRSQGWTVEASPEPAPTVPEKEKK